MRLYNEKVIYEKEMLEQVYINLQELSLVMFAKRAKYFIMLMNSIINLQIYELPKGEDDRGGT